MMGGPGGGGPPNNTSRAFRARAPPKPPQLHYCEVCKISCAGPQTYKEHLEGQKHKKKEAALKTGSSGPTTRGGNALRCELCDVTCTGSDAYAAHIRGSKHQKVVKLHTKLGKPIPSVDPVLVSKGGGGGEGEGEAGGATMGKSGPVQQQQQQHQQHMAQKTAVPYSPVTKQMPIPRINFIQPGKQETKPQTPHVAAASSSGSHQNPPLPPPVPAAAAVVASSSSPSPAASSASVSASIPTEVNIPRLPEERDVQPVGHDYIEEIRQDGPGGPGGPGGKVISFNCKLCECRFNDPNAKEMHMKGRRHRLQYKKKVNPDLVVDVKPSLRQRKLAEERAKRSQAKEDFWKRREEEFKLVEEEERAYWEERRKFEEEHSEMFGYGGRFGGGGGGGMRPPMMHHLSGGPRFGPPPPHGMGPSHPRHHHPHHHGSNAPMWPYGFPPGPPPHHHGHGPPPGPPGMMLRRPDTVDDRHVLAKHAEIYPEDGELDEIQRAVASLERALKMVSDRIAEEDEAKRKAKEAKSKEDGNKSTSAVAGEGGSTENGSNADKDRVLKGVMRVGVLAKGLVLRGDRHFRLVVLCGEKPTAGLLERISAALPAQLLSAQATIKAETAASTTDNAGEGDSSSSSGAKVASQPKFSVVKDIKAGGLTVTYSREGGPVGKLEVEVSLTSPLMRDETSGPNPEGTLDPEKCLEALAALRHAKWFQARSQGRQSCVLVLRILRDFCRRVPTWAPVRLFSLELLAEKVLASAGVPLSPGDALRRVFEAVAGGVLMPDGPGLLDPCEREPQDAAAALTSQQRGDITSSAQHALRLIAFRQVHKVLGIEALPPPKYAGAAAAAAAGSSSSSGGGGGGRFSRKRRRDDSVGAEGDEDVEQEEKKDKKGAEDKLDTDGGGGGGGNKGAAAAAEVGEGGVGPAVKKE